MTTFAKQGYIVCPLGVKPGQNQHLHDNVLKALLTGPEFKSELPPYSYLTRTGNKKTKEFQPVGGGFGGMGNPSSFHNSTVRRLRVVLFKKALPAITSLLYHLYPDTASEWNLSQLLDRALYRLKGEKPTKESWHHDDSPSSDPSDIILGGWINCDVKETQYFSCIPGTHSLKEGKTSTGFIPFNKKKKAEVAKMKNVKVAIPPGHFILFFQSIYHEVAPTKGSYNMLRLFVGFRLTKQLDPLCPAIMQIIDDQGVPPLKSDQQPPMYPKLWWVNFIPRLVAWSQNFNPRVLVTRKRRNNTLGTDEDITAVPRHMGSLREMGLPMYNPYTLGERSMHTPNNTWTIKGSRYNLHKNNKRQRL
jgi:hypothetical protein